MPKALGHLPAPIQNLPVPLRVAVYGEGGVGKTTFALSFPKPLVIDTDGGLEGDAVADLHDLAEAWTPGNWGDLTALSFWLDKEIATKGYQTIVVDSIDTLARQVLMEASRQATKGRAVDAIDTELVSSEQQDFGKVHVALGAFLDNLKALSRKHGVNVVLTSQVREVDIEKKRFKRTFDVQPAVEKIITAWANVYGEMVVVTQDKVERRLLFTNVADTARKSKSRFAVLRPAVADPTFTKMANAITEATASGEDTTQ